MRRTGNINNLTFGIRHLRFETHLAGAEETFATLAAVVQNFAQDVRNEVMNDAVVFFRKRIVYYIQEGKKESRVPDHSPRSYDLASTFKSFFTETDTVRVSIGEGVPYALIHSLPPGQTRTIMAQNYRFMIFHWYRLGTEGKKVAAFSVERPGVGYWDRAIEDVKDEMPKILKRQIDYFARQEGSHIAGKTGAHLRGKPRLRYNARARSGRL